MIDDSKSLPDPSLELYVDAVLGKKAIDIVLLDVGGLTSIADVFIVCSGRSNRQVNAIAEHVQRHLKKHKIRPLGMEGAKEGHWVLLDYGHVIFHIFYKPVREFYDIEGLWADAERIETESLKKYREKSNKMEPDDE